MGKKLLYKYVCIVDYEKTEIENKNVTDDLNGYILKLYHTIEDSEKLQFFKEKDLTTQVLNNVLQVVKCISDDNTDAISSIMDKISNRLRDKEQDAQGKIDHMGKQVKKGSLLQAVFQDPKYDEYEYLISKAEHTNYMEGTSYNIEEGFNVDKKNLWKSCLIRCSVEEGNVKIKEIRIYLDNQAKYWTREFLELEELRNDEQNTQQFFREIDRVLKKDVRKYSHEDYNVLRGSIIEHIRSAEQIDYPNIIKTKFERYEYVNLDEEQKSKLIVNLKKLPEKGVFDTQFAPNPDALGVRIIKQTYKLTNDVELVIKDITSDHKIEAFEDETGRKYVQIQTDDEAIFRRYRKIEI